ncbi:hypothetical protein A3197_17430 [Candidatus Thiodiazotropha endoloripes]|nr:hypothetical protein A3197_17430 [Candidatus Thiodiazotropha endoloripes]
MGEASDAELQDTVFGAVPVGADSNTVSAAQSDDDLDYAWQGDIYGLSVSGLAVGPEDLYTYSDQQDAWKAPPESGFVDTISEIWDDPYLPRVEKLRQGIQAVFAPDQYKAERQHSPFEWGAVASGLAKNIWNDVAVTVNTANMIGYFTNPAAMLSGVEPVILPQAKIDDAELRGSGGAQALSWVGGLSAMVRGNGLTVPDSTAQRSIAAANIKEARNILKDAGVPLHSRNEIIRSYDLETFRVERTASERMEFRVFDDFSARLEGRYVSPDYIASQTDRITNFALPSNSATRLGSVTIPENSVVFTGRVAPQPDFSPGLTGGARQTFLTGPLSNYRYEEILWSHK